MVKLLCLPLVLVVVSLLSLKRLLLTFLLRQLIRLDSLVWKRVLEIQPRSLSQWHLNVTSWTLRLLQKMNSAEDTRLCLVTSDWFSLIIKGPWATHLLSTRSSTWPLWDASTSFLITLLSRYRKALRGYLVTKRWTK